MLEYEWGNPTAIILSGEDPNQEPDPNRQIFDHYTTNATTQQQSFNETLLSHQHNAVFAHHNLFHNPNQDETHPQPHAYPHTLYDPRTYSSASAYSTPHPSLLSLDPFSGTGGSGGGYFLVPKTEEVSRPVDFTARIGLNLGGRTYFSSSEDDFVSRLYRRSRPGDPSSTNYPRCQAEGCIADLSNAKHYHRRHKVCEFHSKASTVIAAGLTQRFCQQCSRFHLLSEFDNGKRSCRKRLADHNRRRRKSHQQQQQQPNNQENQVKLENGCNSSGNHQSSPPPPDAGVQSSSSVRVAVSPPRMSLDYFRQRPYNATESSSSSSPSTFFFSSG
ncbi:squamosa promoter binding protein-like 8 [Hibiscus trionum]|uniref:Squamosa promoter binding protein-like 8 n=1 Tax=Hibiscus trionum TaxID=183268 RepID=A0A9W7H343_HIBTR|nr:squamosa promoter binding protein-like 8 [Hibiscus trionum]